MPGDLICYIYNCRKVATSDNLLTFERFCAGLKICLLRNQAEQRSDKESNVRS